VQLLKQSDPGLLLTAGNKARDKRAWSDAARNYQAYLLRRPDDAAIWVQYGHSLKEAGRFQDASDAYHRGLNLMPLDADLHLQIGHLNKVAGQPRAAIASFRRALELDPGLKAAQDELDQLQSVSETRLSLDWRVDVDHRLNDALVRIKLLEQRIREMEAASAPAAPEQ